MKKMLLVTFVLITSAVIAQKAEYKYLYASFLTYENYKWSGEKKQKLVKDANIESITQIEESYNKKGKVKSKKIKAINTFNKDGQLISMSKYRKNKPTTFSYLYDETGLLSGETKTNAKGKIISKVEKSYYSKIQFKEVKIYKKGAATPSQRILYMLDGKNIAQTNYYKKDTIPYQIWKYDYVANQLSKTTLYNKKNKVVYTWVHDCRPEGELMGMKNKDTAMVCKKVEVNSDGSFTKTIINTQNNKVIKQVLTFSKDSTILSNTTYDKEGRIMSKSTYNNKYNNSYEWIQYRTKTGNITNKNNVTYNELDFPIKEEYKFYNKKGEENNSFVNEYSYKSTNLPDKTQHYRKNIKVRSEFYEYSQLTK
jgi:hypothetical protein